MLRTGSHFSGYGSYVFGLRNAGIESQSIFACDNDKYVQNTYKSNHQVQHFYDDVTKVDWSKAPSVDLAILSPPCQGLSLAGLRSNEDSRNKLVWSSHQYILHKRPRFFLIENVKGLLSHDKPLIDPKKEPRLAKLVKNYRFGRTFLSWLEGFGKEVNGISLQDFLAQCPFRKQETGLFASYELPSYCCQYYIRFFVMNSKHFGNPQNRERVFIIGFRDKADYLKFRRPKAFILKKRLKDVLDKNVDPKYFLSDKMLKGLLRRSKEMESKGNGFGLRLKSDNDIANCLLASYSKITKCGNFYLDEKPKVIQLNDINKESNGVQPFQHNRVYDSNGISPALTCDKRHIKIIEEPKALSFSRTAEAKIKRAQNLKNGFDSCPFSDKLLGLRKDGIMPALTTGPNKENLVMVPDPERLQFARGFNKGGLFKEICPTISTNSWDRNNILKYAGRIRRLTPNECRRLMGLPEGFIQNNSDTQAYKQYGNGIDVHVLTSIFLQFKLLLNQ